MNKIYLDCTHTYNSGQNTGIQRVVKNIVQNRFEVSKLFGIEIVPVVFYNKEYKKFDRFPDIRATSSIKKYKVKNILKKVLSFFRKFFSKVKVIDDFLHNPKFILKLNSYYERVFVSYHVEDEKVEFSQNDILLFLDATWLNSEYKFYESLKNRYGIKIVATIYDLIPINQSQFCSVDLTLTLKDWFEKSINLVDAYIGISKFVQKECYEYIKNSLNSDVLESKFDYFYLGANLKDFDLSKADIRDDFKNIFNTKNVFITVSTIEPRKNHKYIVDSFDKLWENGVDVRYVIIGKVGWEVDDFISRVKNHKEYNSRLFLLENIDDEHLLYAYKNSKALIFASFIEGFGLPIIESLHNKLQVLASDIDVHREIGRDFVSYFNLNDINSLIKLIEDDNFNKNIDDFKWISWEESAKDLVEKVLKVE
ncbi:glycosyltransferase family 4 protein [Aliarcobacter cryaerophilus]|uniref:glycosyltransferase family 4 protein n=1 Tax=Aliarcobacter cryaerophilus TaxID=28198 RepID=UPI003DA53763